MDRSRRAQIAQETVQILEAGRYQTASGKNVAICDLIERARQGTVSYPPDCDVPMPTPTKRKTPIEVVNTTTLSAARRVVEEGFVPAVLNFASAKHPGGGFLSGAQAQEESLARASALYACLVGNEMYDYHRRQRDPMYTNYVIYSPDVPVFRDDEGQLLSEPYCVAFLTAPAVNATEVFRQGTADQEMIAAEMKRRIDKVLAIAAKHGHVALVLGAWGCGVFGNDPETIAELFARAFHNEFSGVFERVVFAILDRSSNKQIIGPFERHLAS
ncbi:MAG: TIGR02452 family protein [Gemmatales bacterium]|nr:MAG: TIGR02452 family protein [Gemmatales bacterium]